MSQDTAAKSKKTTSRVSKEPHVVTPTSQAFNPSGARITRSASQEAKDNAEQHVKHIDARKQLASENILGYAEPCTPQSLSKALLQLTVKHNKSSSQLLKAILNISTIIETMDTHCAGCTRTDFLSDLVKDHCSDIQLGLEEKMDEIHQAIGDKIPSPDKSAENLARIDDASRTLSKVANDLEALLTKASDSTTQLANTARSYRDALVNVPSQIQNARHEGGGRVDDALSAVTDRKDRQVLIEAPEEQILSISIDSIKEKLQDAFKQVLNPPPPADMSIVHISRARKPGIIINFKTKEAADWLRSSEVGLAFEGFFLTGTIVKPRHYAVMVPRVPIIFDPDAQEHLREIEEVNGLAKYAIAKARWIKPTYRRKPGQRIAHASFLITDVNLANRCIKEGLEVCGARTYPTKLKQEPAQCMKCRGWGHFANECNQTSSTCGTCGGEHRTSDCEVENRRFCVSCRSDSHASWDRNCPEFIKRCAWYDDKHPDNTLKYFPTDEAWTQETRPARIPHRDRFPARFAVTPLPPPIRNAQEQPAGAIDRPPKRHRGSRNLPAGQTTLARYFQPSQSQVRNCSRDSSVIREEGEVTSEIFNTSGHSVYEEAGTFTTADGWS